MFEPTEESLLKYECPEWFQDSKIGVYLHWSPPSVPAFNGHYVRYMYYRNQDEVSDWAKGVYDYHVKNYEHSSEFGIKDFIPLWKAEKWNPHIGKIL